MKKEIKDLEVDGNGERKYWENLWGGIKDTLTSKDFLYLLDKIKVEHLLPLLPKTGKTLEVGAGSGRLSCFLALHGYDTTCLDYEPEALRVAKNNYQFANVKGTFVIGDANNLPFKDDSFDILLSTGLLEHFRNPQPIICEMVRCLKGGGLLYSDVVPNKFSLLRLFNFLYKSRSHRTEAFYESQITKEEIVNILHNSGLRNIEIFSAGVLPPESIPLICRFPFVRLYETKVVYALKPLWKRLDKTIFADWLGFYYFVYGCKPKKNK